MAINLNWEESQNSKGIQVYIYIDDGDDDDSSIYKRIYILSTKQAVEWYNLFILHPWNESSEPFKCTHAKHLVGYIQISICKQRSIENMMDGSISCANQTPLRKFNSNSSFLCCSIYRLYIPFSFSFGKINAHTHCHFQKEVLKPTHLFLPLTLHAPIFIYASDSLHRRLFNFNHVPKTCNVM